jgi:hypothetical protein
VALKRQSFNHPITSGCQLRSVIEICVCMIGWLIGVIDGPPSQKKCYGGQVLLRQSLPTITLVAVGLRRTCPPTQEMLRRTSWNSNNVWLQMTNDFCYSQPAQSRSDPYEITAGYPLVPMGLRSENFFYLFTFILYLSRWINCPLLFTPDNALGN